LPAESTRRLARVSDRPNEVGLYLGSLIVATVPGACWVMWPNGHPVVGFASGRELDTTAIVRERLTTVMHQCFYLAFAGVHPRERLDQPIALEIAHAVAVVARSSVCVSSPG
jgi:hypothetical protein